MMKELATKPKWQSNRLWQAELACVATMPCVCVCVCVRHMRGWNKAWKSIFNIIQAAQIARISRKCPKKKTTKMRIVACGNNNNKRKNNPYVCTYLLHNSHTLWALFPSCLDLSVGHKNCCKVLQQTHNATQQSTKSAAALLSRRLRRAFFFKWQQFLALLLLCSFTKAEAAAAAATGSGSFEGFAASSSWTLALFLARLSSLVIFLVLLATYKLHLLRLRFHKQQQQKNSLGLNIKVAATKRSIKTLTYKFTPNCCRNLRQCYRGTTFNADIYLYICIYITNPSSPLLYNKLATLTAVSPLFWAVHNGSPERFALVAFRSMRT